MTWSKLGKLLGPELLPFGYSHLTGPVGITMPDRVRIFFTSRRVQAPNFRISEPFFVDLSIDDLSVISEPVKVRVPNPQLGSYRIHGIFPFSVAKSRDGSLVALPTGWRRQRGVDVETAIGQMHSLDFGESWFETGPGPRFSALKNEPHLVCDASYVQFGSEQILAYTFGVDWKKSLEGNPERRYLISVAKNKYFDLIANGSGTAVVPQVMEDEVQAHPHLLQRNGRLEMVFCYRRRFDFRENAKSSYKLGFATSEDAINWIRNDDLISIPRSVGDEEMQAYPSQFELNGKVIVLYNGDKFGGSGIFAAVKEC